MFWYWDLVCNSNSMFGKFALSFTFEFGRKTEKSILYKMFYEICNIKQTRNCSMGKNYENAARLLAYKYLLQLRNYSYIIEHDFYANIWKTCTREGGLVRACSLIPAVGKHICTNKPNI